MNTMTQLKSLGALAVFALAATSAIAADPPFRAGAVAVDITPLKLPARIAGGFLEGRGTKIGDPLYARCLVLDDGKTKIAFAIVDTCMMTQSLIDEAKQLASSQCGIPVDHLMVSATHTHSAPAAMGCLGTRQDKDYAAWLPGKIAEGIVAATKKLEPARIGWASIDDWEHTHNRRWIRKSEHKIVDPFGNATGLAHMHPGYLSAEIIGPSGPVDPGLSVLSVQTPQGRPIAVLANYSQHYFGASPVSSDYYGLFCKHLAGLLDQQGEGNGPFVCAMSQGTSGDLMWMDYGSARKTTTIDSYAEAVAESAKRALEKVQYHDSVPLAMVEKRLKLDYRVPDEKRLEWAKPIAAGIKDDLAKNQQEVYAKEALILHERQQTEIKLQAIRIGELSIATLPNEVYALTGLKLKAQSPFTAHFNIELANGAEGYIPTPEQHVLGGYTTWPARTAGLEVQAEPKIVATLLGALEEATGRNRRSMQDDHGPYAEAVLGAKPTAYWRLNDADGTTARNAVVGGVAARIGDGAAWYLPGVGSGTGTGAGETLTPSAFSGPRQINRALHLAGGDVQAEVNGLGDHYSIALWFWLGEPSGASERGGTLVAGPGGESLESRQFKDHRVRLVLDGSVSKTELSAADWHLAVLVRDGNEVRVYVDGQETPEIVKTLPVQPKNNRLILGHGLQGKLDEVAVFGRALASAEIMAFWKASGIGERRAGEETGKATPSPTSGTQPAAPPLSPEDSLRKIHVPAGFKAELVASEPLVLDPVAFDWDERGRLWVVEMADYPLGMDNNGKPGGRVRLLEDTNGDGRYDKSTLFADELNFPNGILTWRDGVIVTAAPDILFLRDTDGDGRADVREVLFHGLNEGNQQLRANGLRWGLDNWVYCANGGHHVNYGKDTRVESTKTGLKLEVGSRDFRFRPDTGELELESGPTQFGRNRDPWGHWFGTQNANPLWHYVLADRYLLRNPYVPAATPLKHIVGPGSPVVFPASEPEKRYHSFQQAGRFTSACGSMIYGDEQLFGPGPALHALTCEPFHNLVQHNVLDDSGVSFTAHRAKGEEKLDFFASEDRWCRPVMIRTGPDGALWVADMYRYMIEHPQWLPPEGKAELLPHYRLGDDRGRIYRIVPEQPAPRTPLRLDALNTAGLVAALDTPNDWRRDKAQQMLLWKHDADAAPLLEKLARSSSRPQTRLQALCTLDGLGALQPAQLLPALADEHPRLRENALRLAEARGTPEVIAAATKLVNDPDAKVRLQLAFTLGEWKAPAAATALAELAVRNADDPFLVTAVMSSALPHAKPLLQAILLSKQTVVETYSEPLLRLSLGTGDTEATATLLGASLSPEHGDPIRNFSRLLVALERTGSSWQKLQSSAGDKSLATVIQAARRLFSEAIAAAGDDDRKADDRIAAATLLCHSPEHRAAGVAALAEWLRPQFAAETQSQAIAVLAQSGANEVPALLAKAWPELSPALREQTLDAWLSRKAWTEDLVQRLESREITSSSVDPTRRDRLVRHPLKPIARRAERIFNTSGSPSRAKIVEQYRSALKLPADAAKGKQVYVRACASCHQRGDEGRDIGPNLVTVMAHSPEKLLTNILDPNADIQPGFQVYNLALDSGTILSGLLAAETANSLSIKLADGTIRTVARREVEMLHNSSTSLMPEELERVLQPQELADLIAFLRQPIQNESP